MLPNLSVPQFPVLKELIKTQERGEASYKREFMTIASSGKESSPFAIWSLHILLFVLKAHSSPGVSLNSLSSLMSS